MLGRIRRLESPAPESKDAENPWEMEKEQRGVNPVLSYLFSGWFSSLRIPSGLNVALRTREDFFLQLPSLLEHGLNVCQL